MGIGLHACQTEHLYWRTNPKPGGTRLKTGRWNTQFDVTSIVSLLEDDEANCQGRRL